MRWMQLAARGGLLALLASVLIGCAGGGQAPPVPTPGAPAGPPAPGKPGVATVGLRDFALDLSQNPMAPGTYTFIAEQRGQAPHALSIEGPGVSEVTTPVIPRGGGSQQLTVTLQPGTYELWCPVGGHRQQGMESRLTVR
ncbi:hypothetical protein GCM10027597_05050 [Saccharopolyspora tripterygii]